MLYYITPILHGERNQREKLEVYQNLPGANLPETKLGESPGMPLVFHDIQKHPCMLPAPQHHSKRVFPLLSWAGKGCLSLHRTGPSDLYKVHKVHRQGQQGREGQADGGMSEFVECWIPALFHLLLEQTNTSELKILYIFTTPIWPLPTTARQKRAPILNSISHRVQTVISALGGVRNKTHLVLGSSCPGI